MIALGILKASLTILVVELSIRLRVSLSKQLLRGRAEETDHLSESSAIRKFVGSRGDTAEDINISEQFPHLYTTVSNPFRRYQHLTDTYHHAKVPDISRVGPSGLEHNLGSGVGLRLNVVVGLLQNIASNSQTKVGDFHVVNVPLHATEVGTRLVNWAALSFQARCRIRLLASDVVFKDIGALEWHHEVISLEVGMDNVGFGVEEVKALQDAGQDLFDLARRQSAIVAALLAQHPEGLAERLESHAKMLSMRTLDLK